MKKSNLRLGKRKIFNIPVLQFVGLATLLVLLITTVVGVMAGGSFDIRNYAKERNTTRPNCSSKCYGNSQYVLNTKTNTCELQRSNRCSFNRNSKEEVICSDFSSKGSCGGDMCAWYACGNKGKGSCHAKGTPTSIVCP